MYQFADEWSELSPRRLLFGLRHLGHHGGSEVALCRRLNEIFVRCPDGTCLSVGRNPSRPWFFAAFRGTVSPSSPSCSWAAPDFSPSGTLVAAASANFRLAASALAAAPSLSRSGCSVFAGKPVMYLSPRGAIDFCSWTRRWLCLRRSEDRMLGRIGTLARSALSTGSSRLDVRKFLSSTPPPCPGPSRSNTHAVSQRGRRRIDAGGGRFPTLGAVATEQSAFSAFTERVAARLSRLRCRTRKVSRRSRGGGGPAPRHRVRQAGWRRRPR